MKSVVEMLVELLKKYRGTNWRCRAVQLSLIVSVSLGATLALRQDNIQLHSKPYIIQGYSLTAARLAVESTGAEVTHVLTIIKAVAAKLTRNQYNALSHHRDIKRIYPDLDLMTSAQAGTYVDQGKRRDTFYPREVYADQLHVESITGNGITIAVVDSGLGHHRPLIENTRGEYRVLANFDVTNSWEDQDDVKTDKSGKETKGKGKEEKGKKEKGKKKEAKGGDNDKYGHGSHLTSIIASSAETRSVDGLYTGTYNGIAPDVNLVVVKAFDKKGISTYAKVIAAIDFVVTNKDLYDIRVLNLSMSGTVRSHYWDDPLNQAVMAAYQAGIVVVASAGNRGPGAMSIGVPGNVPYIITVGAMSDNYTPDIVNDDYLPSFSSAGPTHEGFVKPELVAPGGHMIGLMKRHTVLATEHPEFHDGNDFYQMSGTSQAAALTSGVVALMLQFDPDLTPDDVKCRLMSSAAPGAKADGSLAYSIFQQGAGMVNAYRAVYSTASGCANNGINVANDLNDVAHYGGRANVNAEGSYYIMDADGYLWNAGYLWNDGYLWNAGFLWNDGYLWNAGFLWNDGFLWSDGYLWSDGFLWNDVSLSNSVGITESVPQE